MTARALGQAGARLTMIFNEEECQDTLGNADQKCKEVSLAA